MRPGRASNWDCDCPKVTHLWDASVVSPYIPSPSCACIQFEARSWYPPFECQSDWRKRPQNALCRITRSMLIARITYKIGHGAFKLNWVLVVKTLTDVRYHRYHRASKIDNIFFDIRFIVQQRSHYYNIYFLWQVGSDQEALPPKGNANIIYVCLMIRLVRLVHLHVNLSRYAFIILWLHPTLVSLSPCRHVVEAWCVHAGRKGTNGGATDCHHEAAGNMVR